MELGDESDDAGPYNDEADRVGLEVCLRRYTSHTRIAHAHAPPHTHGTTHDIDMPRTTIRIPRAIQKARAFSCHTCPHVPGCPWPPVVTVPPPPPPPPPLQRLFTRSTCEPTQKLEINQLPKKEADIVREELVCFHSRRHFTEDVLGIDISLIWNNRCENLTIVVTIVTAIIIVVIAALHS
jgi:hypothetical protein